MLNSTEISKELLSEVTGKEIREFVIENNELRYILEDDTNSISDLHFINIYELAHKCKEWAFKQDYSYLGNKGLINIYSKTGTMVSIMDKNVANWFDLYIDFKACEWVLKEIKK